MYCPPHSSVAQLQRPLKEFVAQRNLHIIQISFTLNHLTEIDQQITVIPWIYTMLVYVTFSVY